MSDYFDELLDRLRENHVSINPPYLHGLLTGFATTPEPDLENWSWRFLGNSHYRTLSGKS